MKTATSGPPASPRQPVQRVAAIDEDECIGCALCIKACPVDAIVGAHTFMHAVVEPECIGCELCVAPCPADCISMIETRVARTAHNRAQFARERRRRRDLRRAAHTARYAGAVQARREELKSLIRRKPPAGAPNGGQDE